MENLRSKGRMEKRSYKGRVGGTGQLGATLESDSTMVPQHLYPNASGTSQGGEIKTHISAVM